MIRILHKIVRTGIVSEDAPDPREELRTRAPEIQAEVLRLLGRALAIRQVDAGSCNGCELEIHALNNPYYNLEGLGIRFVASPRHADMLLVTGPVAKNMEHALGSPTRRRPTRSWWSPSATAAAPAGSSARAMRAAGAWRT